MRLGAVDQESAHFAEGAELGGVAEPAACTGIGRGRWIGDELVRDFAEACVAKHFFPFVRGEQVHGDFELFRPLMAIGIVAKKVDENPCRATFGEDAKVSRMPRAGSGQ